MLYHDLKNWFRGTNLHMLTPNLPVVQDCVSESLIDNLLCSLKNPDSLAPPEIELLLREERAQICVSIEKRLIYSILYRDLSKITTKN